MSIKADRWIRRMAEEHGMIEPFVAGQVRESSEGRVISYGTSSYGYDIRCADEFKIFTNINSAIVDPKNFDSNSFVDLKSDVCIIPPNSFALARTVEYFRIPRDVLTLCLGKSTYARCFRGDTRVALVDGSAPTLEEMARRADDGEMFWGYSIGQFGRVITTLLEAPRYIGRDALLEVTLDNGEVIRCTPDHEFVLRDGRLIQADQLRPNDSLMPLYRQLAGGYEVVYQPANGHLYPTHRLSDEWNLRNGIYSDQPGTHRHHKDFNRRNNLPWNIERLPAGEHIRLHNAENYGEDFDPGEHNRAIRDAFERLRRDPNWLKHFRAEQRGLANRFWSDDRYTETREPLCQTHRANWTDERRLLQSKAMDRYYSDPAARRRSGELARQGLSALRGIGPQQQNHKVTRVAEIAGDHDTYCLTVPEAGNFALASGVFVRNCGIIVNVTPLEPEWEGHVTLEFSNTTPLPAKIYANEGVAQILFFESDEPCENSYRDRGGKYQGQTGVTLPKP